MTRWRCPVCDRRFEYDGSLQPVCTGPRDMDDHEATPMEREE